MEPSPLCSSLSQAPPSYEDVLQSSSPWLAPRDLHKSLSVDGELSMAPTPNIPAQRPAHMGTPTTPPSPPPRVRSRTSDAQSQPPGRSWRPPVAPRSPKLTRAASLQPGEAATPNHSRPSVAENDGVGLSRDIAAANVASGSAGGSRPRPAPRPSAAVQETLLWAPKDTRLCLPNIPTTGQGRKWVGCVPVMDGCPLLKRTKRRCPSGS